MTKGLRQPSTRRGEEQQGDHARSGGVSRRNRWGSKLTTVVATLGFLAWLISPVGADWNGWNPGVGAGQPNFSIMYPSPSLACQSWANYRSWASPPGKGIVSLTGMAPQRNQFGHLRTFVCHIEGYLPVTQPPGFADPTHATCTLPEVFDPKAIDGCSLPPPPEKDEGAPCCPEVQCCRDKGKPASGNPITVATGNKFEQVVDFSTAGPNPLTFSRSYNSFLHRGETALGMGWRSNYDRTLVLESTITTHAIRSDGQTLTFTLANGVWEAETDVPDTLVTDGTTWTLTDANDAQEVYDSAGRLQTITTRAGYQQTLAYDGNDDLQSVTDTFGRQLLFTFEEGRLATMTTPAGAVYRYTYDRTIPYLLEPDRLIGVTYPDATPVDPTDNPTRTYLYEDIDFLFALTGILDEEGTRLATFAYDADGRGIMSEHANGAGRVDLVHHGDNTTTVTKASGQSFLYHFSLVEGAHKVVQVDRLATATVPAATETFTYDANGYQASHTDWNGIQTTYQVDAQGREVSRTDAVGTPEARTITTTWHATWHLPTQIVEPRKTTDFTYDAQGHVLTRTETDTTGGPSQGQTRTWTYTYTPTGHVATMDGPRTDVVDLTTYTYTIEGYLKTTTNALGHVTDVTSHSLNGLPTILTDANGTETHLTYHPRGWLQSSTIMSDQGDATTAFTYDDSGQVTRITRPDGSVLAYEYDDAQRVVAVSNGRNERIEYTLNAAGNRLSETVKSDTGNIVRTQTRTFDSLNRILTQVGGAAQTTTYSYDANGNRLVITDPLTNQTQQAYDALNRLISVTDAATNTATYGYNAQEQLTTVTDPRALTTTYVYNAFGDVLQQTSPDTGTTTYTLDSAGNRTQATDARGVVTTMTYDALNRVTTRQFPATPSQNITYTYDATAGGNHGVGRLTGFTDASGNTSYVYDDRGNVVTDTRVIGTHTAVTTYAYTLADHLTEITYPSGRLLTYHRDTQGRVTSVTTQATSGSPPSVVASGLTYQPFGPLATLTYGNGLVLTLSYDQDYRLTGLTTTDGSTVIQDLTYTYDAADNLTAITDLLSPARTQTLGYDALHRLTSATGVYGTLGYTFDAVGNRLTRTAGGQTETLSYAATSNRLLSTTVGGTTRSFTYLANGQITTDTRSATEAYTLTYADPNRLTQVTKNGVPTYAYAYNALGQRVSKDALAGGTDSHAVYDRQGRLLVETDTLGQATKEYAYLDGLPLAVFDPGATGGSPALDLILDNGDPGVATTGTWTTTTAGSGYEGTDYLVHDLSGLVVDDTAAGFTTTGTWTTQHTGTGYVGTTYRTRNTASPTPLEVIVDNLDPEFSVVGTWTTDAEEDDYFADFLRHGPTGLPPVADIYDNDGAYFVAAGAWNAATLPLGFEGADYAKLDAGILPAAAQIYQQDDPIASWTGTWYDQPWNGIRVHAPSTTTTDTFTWTLPITETKVYHLYAQWHQYWARPTNATYTIVHAGGSTPVVVDQKVNGRPTWNYLGAFTLEPGQSHRVELSGQSNGWPCADAIAVVPGDAAPNLATWQPPLATAGDYGVYGRWPANAAANPSATYRLFHDDGTTDIVVDQTTAGPGGQWVPFGLFSLAPNEDHRVELEGDFDYETGADAIALSTTPIAATWTPDLPITDTYNVYAWWSADGAAHPQATYVVTHAGGTSQVTVDQTQNGGQWALLGTYDMAPGQNHRVMLPIAMGGDVLADAIKFEAADGSTPRAATWALPVTTTGAYDVYARWVADPAHATNATYTVHYAGGSTPITVNQTQDGGTWQLLGTFTLDPALNPQVVLSDQANGTVVADAVLVVPSGTSTDRVTYTPTFPSATTVDIYAKWGENATRAPGVRYAIQHSGGSTDITVNQQQPSGGWAHLGSYAMAPGQNHGVDVYGALEGETVGDAIRFVTAGVSAPGIHYVHADHLGSPQKMTDSTKALVWDAVLTPYGQVHSLTGTGVNNQRFPGQYADAETGFHYNYFRDYDPTTGRYIQSDPIGLLAGMNTYSYANLNPLLFTDPKGLDGSLEPPRPLGPQGPLSSPNYQKDPLCLAITCTPDGYYYPSDFPGDKKCLKDCFEKANQIQRLWGPYPFWSDSSSIRSLGAWAKGKEALLQCAKECDKCSDN